MAAPRVVVVLRKTEYRRLIERHATHGQARFFLETRGQSIDEVQRRHHHFEAQLTIVENSIPRAWRRARVEREDLHRFLFEPDDVIAVVGQDGLVANVAKYLDGQRVVGINPEPRRFDGVLVRHRAEDAAQAIATATTRRSSGRHPHIESRVMVEARLDDGQRLLALNEIFVGHRSHQSARYELSVQGQREAQSSSGLIVASGTGATGWARSIHLSRQSPLSLPNPEQPRLVYFVREAFPSVATGTDVTEGVIDGDVELVVTSRMEEGGAVFGDGIEDDRLSFGWGARVRLRIAPQRLELVTGDRAVRETRAASPRGRRRRGDGGRRKPSSARA